MIVKIILRINPNLYGSFHHSKTNRLTKGTILSFYCSQDNDNTLGIVNLLLKQYAIDINLTAPQSDSGDGCTALMNSINLLEDKQRRFHLVKLLLKQPSLLINEVTNNEIQSTALMTAAALDSEKSCIQTLELRHQKNQNYMWSLMTLA